MASKGVIPIKDAERIGRDRNCPVVVIWAIESGRDRFTVTTWGRDRKLCRHAADMGRKLTRVILDGTVEPAAVEPLDVPETPTFTEAQAKDAEEQG